MRMRTGIRLLTAALVVALSTFVGFRLLAQPPGLPTVQFTQANTYYVGEGGPGGTVTLTVQLDAPSTLPVTFQYATSNNTAVAPTDYVQKNGSLTIPAGQTQATITVSIVNDGVLKPTRFATVTMSNPVNAVLGTLNTCTFTSDEVLAGLLSVADYTETLELTDETRASVAKGRKEILEIIEFRKAGKPQVISKHIANLDSADFKVRDEATRELKAFGDWALPQLRTALENPPSTEARARIQLLIDDIGAKESKRRQ